jgi:DNA-directed RNA polymerase subunit A'
MTPDTYYDDGFPIEGGLMDLRLGVINPGLTCKTCGGRMTTCTGHFGVIEMVRPVVHIGYMKIILTLLKATCKKCGKILIPKEKLQEYRDLMLREELEEQEELTIEIILKGKKSTKCPSCKDKQGQIKLLRPTTFFEGEQRLFPSQIRERLERINEHDLKLLGINPDVARPEWTILPVLPVSPVTTRPSITLETGERSEDDLTHKLVDILRINQRLADNISAGAPQLIIEDLWDLLQYHVNTYFNNEVSGIPPARHRSGRPLKTLFQRLKGKEGRIRGYLSGKRVNFSARTVISPDPSLSISEVGVPEIIAKELTVPEYVTEWNIDSMKKLIKNKDYPRANYVIRPDNTRKKITDLNKAEIIDELAAGYLVERQLMDNDIALFNRQPSLHRVSMMAHKIRVLPGKTFRINDAVANPYNADYDGDEMNLHIPQTEEAKAEADNLMKVENHILSVRTGGPVIAPSQDSITGSYLLTRKEALFSKEQAAILLGKVGIKKFPKNTNGKIRGKDIFSAILPKDISIRYKQNIKDRCCVCEAGKCSEDGHVVIENGELKHGVIDKKCYGNNGVLVMIYKRDGPAAAREFLDNVSKLALEVFAFSGYTIGISEYDLSDEARKKIDNFFKKGEENVNEIIERYKRGDLERVPGKSIRETLEDMIMAELDRVWRSAGLVAEDDLGSDNFAVVMEKSGARGSFINVTQMGAGLGPTAVRGKRIIRGYRKKALPYFKDGDISAPARGFVKSSFKKGLTPIEFFFHAMSGRDALVDKGINTARSGYMQRRLINALLDITLRPDRSARDSAGTIIQYMYGEDGLNPIYATNDVDFVDYKKYFGEGVKVKK